MALFGRGFDSPRLHPKGFFEQFPLFSSEHSLAIAVQEQAVAEHLVQAGCSTLVSVKTHAFWEDGPDGQLDGFCISLIDNVSEVV